MNPVPPPPDSPAVGSDMPSGLVEVGTYRQERDAAAHGLVILSMRLGYWIEPTLEGYSLRVPATVAEEVRAQLALYDRESAHWPPPLRQLARLRFTWAWPLAWVVVTAFIYWLQVERPGVLEASGSLRADRVFGAAEVWRPATALFLHADLAHLVANLGAGFFLFGLALGELGARRGGLLVVAAAVAGNMLAAALHPGAGYASLGASTAVFGALGLLTGAAVRDVFRSAGPVSWRALLVPLLAGGTLLALYGSGGLQTDVIAHATGFAAGSLLGALVRRRPPAISG